MTKKTLTFTIYFFLSTFCLFSQKNIETEIETGAEQIEKYITILKGKNVAVVVNHTSYVKKIHLVDTLQSLGIKIKVIFSPEHGYKGTAGAGESVLNGTDEKNKISIVSLYGKSKRPTPEHLKNIDIVLYDIQDVGVRFYTYIVTMHYIMEACAENKIPFLVLDRPNPNNYVDGPVLDLKFQSFVGWQKIPVVYGCTVGELAKMINGEKWLRHKNQCLLTVIPCKNYTRKMDYVLPIAPSPNLPNSQSIALYPSLCFFEGTSISVGRGTDLPFQIVGSPNSKNGTYTFTPEDKTGAKDPPQEGILCYGQDLSRVKFKPHFTLEFLLDFYKKRTPIDPFFTHEKHFNLLAGTDKLRKMIVEGKTEKQIRNSWQKDLQAYKKIQSKYLLYGVN